MLSFQPQGADGQRSRQQGKPQRQKQDNKSGKQHADRKGKQQSPFSQDNVFQKQQKSNDFSQSRSSRSASAPLALQRGSSTSLSEEELRTDGPIGSFQFDTSSFRKKASRVRELPKFLVYQAPALRAPPVEQEAWDKQNQERMLAIENQTNDPASLYEEFQAIREVERKTMEEKGLVDKEGTRKTLEDAISFRGSCLDMCPVYERIRRSVENDVRKYERDQHGKISRQLAVKAFSRPAAGQPPPLPSDVRPPQILVQTLSYLIESIVPELPESQSFLWDRTRSIRQDFTYQNFSGPEAVECHEKIVRIHIVTLHIMAKSTVDYSQQQELEQMNKAFKTLSEMYTEYRSRGIIAPNEAEFRAYYLLSQIHDPELDREVQSLPSQILKDERVQLALNMRNMVQTNVIERGFQTTENVLNFYKNFFETFKSGKIPILMSYLVEIHLNSIRFYALKSIKRAIHTKSKPYPIDHIQELLAFDTQEELEKFCSYYGINVVVQDGSKQVDLVSLTHASHHLPDQKPLKQPYTTRHDHLHPNIKEIIDSGKSNLETVIPEDPKASFIQQAPTTAAASSSNLFQSSLNTATLATNVNAEKEAKDKEEAQRKHDAEIERMKVLDEKKKKEEDESLRLKREEEEKQAQKQREEQQRLLEVKQRMLQKQEAKKKKRSEIVEDLCGPLLKDLMRQAVHDGVSNVLKPLVTEKVQKKRKKESILNSYSKGLYEAFISEVIYFESLEAVSQNFREKKLKQLLIKKVCDIAQESKKKNDLKKRKREELMEAPKSFGIPKIIKRKKTKHDSSFESPPPANRHGFPSTSTFTSSNQQHHPMPIDLSPFNFDQTLSNLSKYPFQEYEMLVYSEEFQSTTSKFLQRKFAIADGMEKKLEDKGTVLRIIGTDKIDPKNFENVNVLVFNCDGIERIKTQRLLLKELVDGISLNTNFKFDIVVIYWEFEGIIKFSLSEILQELKLPSHDAIGKVQIIKLDPSLNCDGIQNAINHMCEHVELSARGNYNRKYKKPAKPLLPVNEGPQKSILDYKQLQKKKIDIAIDSPADNPLGTSSGIVTRNEKLMKNLDRFIQDSPRNKIPKLLSSGEGVFAAPVQMKKNKNKASLFGGTSPLHFDDVFKPKKSKIKVDVYSTPRPKSSDLLQTPSFAANSSSISNISNITFANNSVSTPILSKPQQVKSGEKTTTTSSSGDGSQEESVPKSILELRKLAASVRERHGKK